MMMETKHECETEDRRGGDVPFYNLHYSYRQNSTPNQWTATK